MKRYSKRLCLPGPCTVPQTCPSQFTLLEGLDVFEILWENGPETQSYVYTLQPDGDPQSVVGTSPLLVTSGPGTFSVQAVNCPLAPQEIVVPSATQCPSSFEVSADGSNIVVTWDTGDPVQQVIYTSVPSSGMVVSASPVSIPTFGGSFEVSIGNCPLAPVVIGICPQNATWNPSGPDIVLTWDSGTFMVTVEFEGAIVFGPALASPDTIVLPNLDYDVFTNCGPLIAPQDWLVFMLEIPDYKILIAPFAGGAVDVIIDWGDGSTEAVLQVAGTHIPHDYSALNTGDIVYMAIKGSITTFSFMLTPTYYTSGYYTLNSLLKMVSAGTTGSAVTSLFHSFDSCYRLQSVPNTPWADNVLNFERAFSECNSLVQDFHKWDVSKGTTFKGMFLAAFDLDGDFTNWVINASDCTSMFLDANAFTGSGLSTWTFGPGPKDFQEMFYGANLFNGDISLWPMTGVTNTRSMLRDCFVFDRDVSGWDMSAVTNIEKMFLSCDAFTGDTSTWDVSLTESINDTFKSCPLWGNNIGSWDIGNITPGSFQDTFENSGITAADVNSTLQAWADDPSWNFPIVFGMLGVPRGTAGEINLGIAKGWTYAPP